MSRDSIGIPLALVFLVSACYFILVILGVIHEIALMSLASAALLFGYGGWVLCFEKKWRPR